MGKRPTKGVAPHQGTCPLTLHPIFDLESHNPNSGFLGPFLHTSISFFVVALGNARELDHPKTHLLTSIIEA
ncbi:hypothetical protein PIB30_091363 [Stylosanthes scabra]|uniref:Uncharacterized protein n=1 Tax=Stylosanthes scabra TaxID=79078 RepID=A0ABU6VTR9_9FABA|nr:hypothetical protein [Stylosanthes scabra]